MHWHIDDTAGARYFPCVNNYVNVYEPWPGLAMCTQACSLEAHLFGQPWSGAFDALVVARVCVSLFLMHGQFWVDLCQIWRVTSLYPPDGYRPVSKHRKCLQARAPRAVYIRHCKRVASSIGPFGNSVRQGATDWEPHARESSTTGARAQQARGVTEYRRREGVPLVNYNYSIFQSLASLWSERHGWM